MPESPKANDFFESSSAAVGDHELRRKLESASARHLDHFAQVKADFPPYDEEREAAHRIKTDAIAHLDELLIDLTSKLEAQGCKVFFAEDAAQARDYIVALAKAKGANNVVKGKSMTTEEIDLNDALAMAGIDAVETDLGEYIVQLRGERPSHIITPAIHLSKEDIGQLFTDKFGIEYTAQPEKLTAEARSRLRAIFLAADFGVTGVNFAIAETGTLIVVENEGNGRLSSTMPETFVAVMGIEKVIPSWRDLEVFLQLLPRSSTAERMNPYTSVWTGVTPGDGPQQFHLVLLDNGRTDALADRVGRQALRCIRCSACLNVCPVYERTGGQAYGSVYPGPIGAILAPQLVNDMHDKQAASLPYASSLCGACYEVCPVRINIPEVLVHLRAEAVEAKGRTPESVGMAALGWIFADARRYENAQKVGSLARHLAPSGRITSLPWPGSKWTSARDVPTPPAESFRMWWRKNRG